MKFKILFIALVFSCFSFGQIIYQDNFGTTAITTSPYTVTPSVFDANLNSFSWSSSIGSYGGFAGNGGAPSQSLSLANSSGTPSLTLTFNVASGFQLNITQFDFWRVRSATGAQNWSMTINGIAVGSGSTPTTGASLGATNVSNAINNLSGTITIVISLSGASGTGTFRLDDFTLLGTITSACSSPSTQATAITASSITPTTATINFTRGNGSGGVLVIAQPTSAVTTDPTSGVTTYVGNAAYGLGTAIGSGFVVYNGVGLGASNPMSVNLTGLTGSTTYHLAAYEYNATGTCFNLIQSVGNFTTLAATPVATIANNGTQVTAAFVDQGTTAHVLHKFQIGVTAANTTLVSIQMTTTGTYVATDVVNFKVRYSADNVLDVADATLSTKTLTLGVGTHTFPAFTSQLINAGTTGYVFITADFSATAVVNNTISVSAFPAAATNLTFLPSGTIKSSTATVGGLQTIRPSAPAVPTNFTKGCSSNTTQQLSWSAPATGSFDGYMLVIREGGLAPHAVTLINASTASPNLNYTVAQTFGSTAPLSRILYVGLGTSVTVTGLTPGVNYYYHLHAYKNNGASASVYSTATSTTQVAGLSNVINPSSTALTSAGSINWTNPNVGCFDEILVVVTTAGGITFSPSGDGTAYIANSVYVAPNQVVYQNNGSFFTITGLTNGVTYYVEIFVKQGTQWSTGVEVSVTPNASTIFKPGELMFVAFDGQVNGSGANDQYMVATMVDILPGTKFSIANSRYEAGAAANIRTDKWGGSGDFAEENPGVVEITYLASESTNIPAGSVLVFTTNGAASVFSYVGVISGTIEADRTAAFSNSATYGTAFAPNISTSGSEQLYLIQGSFTFDGTFDMFQANYFLNGTLLHGLTNRVAWVPLTSACNGSAAGGNTRESRLPVALTCFNLESSSTSSVSGYYENDKEHGSAPLRDIILGISNPSNWTFGSGRYTKDPTSNLLTRTGKTFIIGTGSASTGQWIGDISNDWFNCANWGRLTVPDETIDVLIDTFSTYTNNATISVSSPYASDYNSQAKCNNITMNNRRLVIEANTLNKLEVFGNLSITSGGIVDMDDSTATLDGQIDLYGNWINSVGLASFLEGNGKVNFVGAIDQVINNNVHTNPEEFFNVELNNNFDTSNSNNLIAKGNLQVIAGNSVYIRGNDYIQVNEDLTNNGVLEIDNNGILYQVDDTGVNNGNIVMRRNASIRLQDYVFWSSPIDTFTVSNISTGTPSNVIWKWNPRASNPNGAYGNWINCASDLMEKGKGYIVRGPSGISNTTPTNFTATFQNAIANSAKPNNGIISQRLHRGPMVAANLATYASANTVAFSVNDDNWNLVGNPYPSAISVSSFLNYNSPTTGPNPVIEGSVRIWSHTNLPVSPINPFYNSYQYNYVSTDYITHNGTATISGPTTFNGFIGAGQGFFVLMNDGAETLDADAPINLVFNNSMRVKTLNSNSQFFKTANSTVTATDEKHRIWLDLINNSGNVVRTVVGYLPNATNDKDVMYDAFVRLDGNQNFFSLIEDAKVCIQGRPVPFDNSDLVPLGVAIPTSGNYTIAIAFLDGLFSDSNQNIYVEDLLLDVIHDLRTAPYNFTSASGVFNDRFVLRYTNSTLGNNDFETIENIVVTTQLQQITIKSEFEKMTSVIVYDLLGRELINKTKLSDNEIVLSNINAKNQALIVKINLENGQVVTRKVIL